MTFKQIKFKDLNLKLFNIMNITFLSHIRKRCQITKHTHNTYSLGLICSLRGDGRRGWEARLKNGVRMKQMIIFD